MARRFILRFEAQVQRIDPLVSLPYWDTVKNPQIPGALNTPAFVSSWGLIRFWNPAFLPTASDVASVKARTNFVSFQTMLERIHGGVHNAVGGPDPALGGQMAGPNSPADPLFWLHHANIDRIWAEWQDNNPAKNPPNLTETLKPSPIIQGKVQKYVRISTLGYSYA